MSTVDPVLLVEVDLASRRLLAHSGDLIDFEDQESVQRDASGQLKGCVIEHEKIDTIGERHIEGGGGWLNEVRRDVDVRVRLNPPRGPAPMQVREARTGSPRGNFSTGNRRRRPRPSPREW